MPQSLSQVWLHLVFSTKDRAALLQNPDFRNEMFHMLGHHVAEAGCIPKLAGGWIDHVHIVCGLSRTVTIAGLVQHVKSETSRWAKKAGYGTRSFKWQAGYGVFSVSQSSLDRVMKYVEQQERHHRRRTFQDEFRMLCRKHQLHIDERYVWD
jgi:putative transposase